jgi:hypothetical protein
VSFKNAILQLAEEEFELHPKANLRDYYKIFFQGTFGPGHFVSDYLSAIDFIYQELTESQNFETDLYQKINYRQVFYRVNLLVLKMKLVSFNDYNAGFLASSRFKSNLAVEQWIYEWQRIEKILSESSMEIPNFEKDTQFLQQLFAKNEIVISHSQDYRTAYEPHYRLFTQIEFEKLHITKKSCKSYIY